MTDRERFDSAIRLIEDWLVRHPGGAVGLAQRAFAGYEADPRGGLASAGLPGELAIQWVMHLQTAKSIAGCHPLARLLAAAFRDEQTPAVRYRGGFDGLLKALQHERDLEENAPAERVGLAPSSPARAEVQPVRIPVASTQAHQRQLRERLAVVFGQHHTAGARRAWIDHAFCGKPVCRLEGWEDSAQTFASQVVGWIAGFYDLSCDDGRPVLCHRCPGARSKVLELRCTTHGRRDERCRAQGRQCGPSRGQLIDKNGEITRWAQSDTRARAGTSGGWWTPASVRGCNGS